MKNFLLPITNVVKLHSLLALTMILFGVNFGHAQVISINQTFSSDTIITPFTGSNPVYSLRMSGGINLLSDSSLVRVVLIDPYGNHYLVYEAYPLITHEFVFDTLNASDETTFLDGIICDSLRIDIINAFLDLDSLKLDTNYISNATELQAQAKWDHDSIKIGIMNQRIVEEHMYWRAGRTGFVELFFNEKEELFGLKKFYLQGFDYYQGGIYHELSLPNPVPSNSGIVDSFDWRFRHDANLEESSYYNDQAYGWIPIPNQQQGNTCWAFAAIALAESYSNLYLSPLRKVGRT